MVGLVLVARRPIAGGALAVLGAVLRGGVIIISSTIESAIMRLLSRPAPIDR